MSRHLRVARVPSSEILPAQLAGRGTVSVRGLVSITVRRAWGCRDVGPDVRPPVSCHRPTGIEGARGRESCTMSVRCGARRVWIGRSESSSTPGPRRSGDGGQAGACSSGGSVATLGGRRGWAISGGRRGAIAEVSHTGRVSGSATGAELAFGALPTGSAVEGWTFHSNMSRAVSEGWSKRR